MITSDGVAIATVTSILIVINVVGNSFVCIIVKKNPDMRYVKTKTTVYGNV